MDAQFATSSAWPAWRRWCRAWVCLWVALATGQAWAGWQVLTSSQSGFNVPTAYANLRTINFDTSKVAAEGARVTASSVASPGGFLGLGAGSVNYTSGTGPLLTGLTSNLVDMDSGTSGTPSSFALQFNNGGTSYVAMTVGMSVKQDNTQYIRFTYGSGTQVTLYNCKTVGNATCLANYVPSNWLSDLISGLVGLIFGSNNYDTIYLTYTPAAGESITKIEFFDNNCPSCAGLLASSAQGMWIDNISYVDTTAVPDHLEITTTSATVAANTAITFTIKACADAACATLFTTGMTGTLSVTGVTTTYPGGSTYTIPARSATTTITASMATGTATVALTSPSRTSGGKPTVWCGMGVAAQNGNPCTLTVTTPLHHYEVLTNATSTVTCVPLTFTVKACAVPDCSSLYNQAITATVNVSGTNVTSYSNAVSTSTGTATFTAFMGVATAVNSATATVSLTPYSITPTAAVPVYYGLGAASGTSGGSQSLTLYRAGLVFNVPDHAAESAQTVTVTAIKSVDGSNACSPYLTTTAAIKLACSYNNPSTGTVPVRVKDNASASYTPLNASGSAAAACDATGANVNLAFNASGVATMNVLYADVGAVDMTASYVGNGITAATGTDTFIATPYDFGVAVSTSTNKAAAGSNFSGTVTARNSAGAATPNFGRESTPEGVTLGFVRTVPRITSSAGAVSGGPSSFTAGVGSSSTLRYSEVGKIDLTAILTSGSYLGTGKTAAGSTLGSWVSCASENGTCTIPTGATATVFYGANGLYNYKTGQTGAVSCSNANFSPDPIVGTVKSCKYIASSGTNAATSGTLGPFIPSYFTVTTTNACSSFTYSGQPFTALVKAYNASGSPVVFYDGTDSTATYNTSHNVVLSDPSGSTLGSLTNSLIAASQFSGGQATVTTPTYTFTTKTSPTTAPTALTVRATDTTDSVSSSGHTEGSVSLLSGRLQFSNTFGSEQSTLLVPMQLQYWTGKAWATNTWDTGCTVIPSTSIARSNYVDAKGSASSGSTSWTTAVSGNVTFTNGKGTLSLQAPTWTSGGSGTVAGTVDVAVNLGNATQDSACMGTHPTVTGAGLTWLQAPNGSCSAGNVDPSARMSFGVFSPESRRLIHIHDRY